VLIGEILLHSTRASQVVPIYNKFLRKYPTISALAKASFSDVTEILRPLGLLWRAEALYNMNQEIVTKFKGNIPVEKDDLMSLPGISSYIASAVRCFAFDRPEVLLDTNTVRIIGRVFGIKVTDISRRSKNFRVFYESILPKKNFRDFNYAMLDLGALVCIPSEPLCSICPISQQCVYGRIKLGTTGCGRNSSLS
jgi:A/G-specific adenine glycosylase